MSKRSKRKKNKEVKRAHRFNHIKQIRENRRSFMYEEIRFYAKDAEGTWGWVLLPRYKVEQMQNDILDEIESYTFEQALDIREQWYQSQYPSY